MDTQFQKDWKLFLAVRDGKVDTVRKAIEAGGDPNFIQPPNRNHPLQQQASTLQRAISYGHTDVVELLLDHGAILPTDPDRQYDLSYLARCAGQPKLLDLLIQRGIHPHRDDADWALENSHSELYTRIASLIGDYQLSYDIDQLLASDDFFYNLFKVLPPYHSIHDAILYEPERVLRDLWEYQFSIGNGFSALLMNERYDVVHRSFHALSSIDPTICLQAISDVRNVLEQFDFPLDPDQDIDHWALMSAEDDQGFVDAIGKLDQKYFYSENECNLWNTSSPLEEGRIYANSHIKTLRQRKNRND